MKKKENKTIYAHEIITIWSEKGEVMLETDNGDIIIFNGESLLNDIPHLMTFALRERRNMEKITLELIESGLNDIRKEKKLIEKYYNNENK